GGPFTPLSFEYQLSATTGSITYSISGVPSWLTASSTSGTLTTAPTTVTFSVNGSANSISPGTQNGTVTFANTTNGLGTQARSAFLTVSATSPWQTEAPMLTGRGNFGVGTVNGILYAVGGFNNSGGALTTVEAYDPSANTWT